MSDQLITIQANVRQGSGKTYTRKLRRGGKIPANLLEKGKATMIELDPKLLSKAWKAGKQFNLDFNGTSRAVKIHELQIDHVRREPLHIDLMYV